MQITGSKGVTKKEEIISVVCKKKEVRVSFISAASPLEQRSNSSICQHGTSQPKLNRVCQE
jgi:hypothetical protein